MNSWGSLPFRAIQYVSEQYNKLYSLGAFDFTDTDNTLEYQLENFSEIEHVAQAQQCVLRAYGENQKVHLLWAIFHLMYATGTAHRHLPSCFHGGAIISMSKLSENLICEDSLVVFDKMMSAVFLSHVNPEAATKALFYMLWFLQLQYLRGK